MTYTRGVSFHCHFGRAFAHFVQLGFAVSLGPTDFLEVNAPIKGRLRHLARDVLICEDYEKLEVPENIS